MNLLIVDDQPINLKLLHAQLEAEGHTILEATDGVDALAGLEREQVDAVITDILMPRMDGYRLCYEIRKSDRLHALPVIIYTSTYTSPADEKLALDVGADKYLTKPASLETLVAALQEVTAKSRTAPRAAAMPEVEVLKEYSGQLVAKLEEKNTELIAADEKLYQLLAHSPAVIYTLKLDGRTAVPAVVSDNLELVLGIPAAETAHEGWWLAHLHPDDRDRVIETLTKARMNGGYSMEYRLRHKDGTYHWVEDNNRLTGDSAGQPKEAVGVWTDITGRKLAEEAMRESENKYRHLFESLSDAAFLVDTDKWRIVDTNKQAEELLGLTRGEITGMFLSDFPQPGTATGIREAISTDDAPETPGNCETEIVRKDQRVIPVRVSSAPFIFHGRNLIVSLFRDITARKKREQEIQRLNADLEKRVIERTAELEAANKELEAFSYSVSHDLRNQLFGINAFSALLEKKSGQLDEKGRCYLQEVRSSADRMGQLIDDLLILSRVSRSSLSRGRVNLSDLARAVATDLHAKEPERKVALDIEDGLAADADSRLLRIVFENLLGNAWKFTGKTAEPRIEFGVTERAEGAVFFVRDNGAGFDMAYSERLFNPFQRLHSEDEFSGTGIGLATVRRIIERHGGHVWAEGEVDKGATVFFTLPPVGSVGRK